MPTPASSHADHDYSVRLTQFPQQGLHLLSRKFLQDFLQFLEWRSRWLRLSDMTHQKLFLGIAIQPARSRVSSTTPEKTIEALRQEIPNAASPSNALNHTLVQ